MAVPSHFDFDSDLNACCLRRLWKLVPIFLLVQCINHHRDLSYGLTCHRLVQKRADAICYALPCEFCVEFWWPSVSFLECRFLNFQFQDTEKLVNSFYSSDVSCTGSLQNGQKSSGVTNVDISAIRWKDFGSYWAMPLHSQWSQDSSEHSQKWYPWHQSCTFSRI